MENHRSYPLLLPSGQLADYMDPSGVRIVREDVFPLLWSAKRYGSCLDVNVSQHTAICIALAKLRWPDEPQVHAYVAAHDLHEAYIGEWPRGLKLALHEVCTEKLFRQYAPTNSGLWWSPLDQLEKRWEQYVHIALGLAWPPDPEVAEKIATVDSRAPALEAAIFAPRGWPHQKHIEDLHGGPATPDEMTAAGNANLYHRGAVEAAILLALARSGSAAPTSLPGVVHG